MDLVWEQPTQSRQTRGISISRNLMVTHCTLGKNWRWWAPCVQGMLEQDKPFQEDQSGSLKIPVFISRKTKHQVCLRARTGSYDQRHFSGLCGLTACCAVGTDMMEKLRAAMCSCCLVQPAAPLKNRQMLSSPSAMEKSVRNEENGVVRAGWQQHFVTENYFLHLHNDTNI